VLEEANKQRVTNGKAGITLELRGNLAQENFSDCESQDESGQAAEIEGAADDGAENDGVQDSDSASEPYDSDHSDGA
jgi:hypothetical protein